MKINILYYLGFITLMFFTSCGEEEYQSIESEYGTTNLEAADALLNVNTQVVSFQAGTPSYNLNFDLLNGTKKVSNINVYSSFTDAATQTTSPVILFKSYPVGDNLRTNFSDDVNYSQLKNGITLNGEPLPDDEVSVAIGSGWLMTFEGVTADGTIVPFTNQARVAVLSRFAGIYKVIESAYFRIGSDSGPWTGEERFIGSVDETTFSYNDAWGPFGWAGNTFTFSIDETTNVVTVPLVDDSGQLLNGNALFSGNRAVGCHTEESFFTNVPCEGSNVLEPDDVNGKHIIKLTYGYFTDGSGPREFYEVLEKI